MFHSWWISYSKQYPKYTAPNVYTLHAKNSRWKKDVLYHCLSKYIPSEHMIHWPLFHYNDVIMNAVASQITSLAIVYSTVFSCAYKKKNKNSAPLAFVGGIHRWPVNSPHKGPVTRKMFPFDDVVVCQYAPRNLIAVNIWVTKFRHRYKLGRCWFIR